jgi:hypothetical protein
MAVHLRLLGQLYLRHLGGNRAGKPGRGAGERRAALVQFPALPRPRKDCE